MSEALWWRSTLGPVPRELTVSDSVVIAVDPMTVWEQVADPTQMPRWSGENTGARIEGGRPLREGEVFAGTNKRGRMRWATECVVRRSVPGEQFGFDVRGWGLGTPRGSFPVARWEYTFEPVEGGTRVTETWSDGRRAWPDWLADGFDRLAAGRPFAQFQRRNIARTLAAMKADLEGAAA